MNSTIYLSSKNYLTFFHFCFILDVSLNETFYLSEMVEKMNVETFYNKRVKTLSFVTKTSFTELTLSDLTHETYQFFGKDGGKSDREWAFKGLKEGKAVKIDLEGIKKLKRSQGRLFLIDFIKKMEAQNELDFV